MDVGESFLLILDVLLYIFRLLKQERIHFGGLNPENPPKYVLAIERIGSRDLLHDVFVLSINKLCSVNVIRIWDLLSYISCTKMKALL